MLNEWHWTDYVLGFVGLIISFFSLRWIKNIFAGSDRKLNIQELKMMTSFLFFLVAATYMIHTEGSRPLNTQHVFSDTWLFLIIGALLFVLGMDKFFVVVENFMRLIIQLKGKAVPEIKKPEDEAP